MTLIAPVALFTYDRPFHTKKVLNALIKCDGSEQIDLFVFCDGPRNESTDKETRRILAVRELIRKEKRFKSIKIVEQSSNYGLANSIISGVSQVLEEYNEIIVLEDDIVPSVGFLNYMNDALFLYKENEKVGCIHAWNYDLNVDVPKEDTFFLPGADCWGWATWKSSWELFNVDGEYLLNEIRNRNLDYTFDRRGTYDFQGALQDQIDGKTDSWAIRWHASLVLASKLCLHPTVAIVKNIGLDGSGEHCIEDASLVMKTVKRIAVEKIDVIDSEWFYKAYRDLTKDTNLKKNSVSLTKRIKAIVKTGIRSILSRVDEKIGNPKSQQKDILGWYGDYSSFEEANKVCGSYDSMNILKHCKSAILKVKSGEAAYERDSVCFDKIQYSWGLLAGLQRAATDNKGVLNVLDFGGSLGSSYFQNKTFLEGVELEAWNVVEQEHFVSCGNEFVKDDKLRFCNSIDDVLSQNKCNVLLLSGVL